MQPQPGIHRTVETRHRPNHFTYAPDLSERAHVDEYRTPTWHRGFSREPPKQWVVHYGYRPITEPARNALRCRHYTIQPAGHPLLNEVEQEGQRLPEYSRYPVFGQDLLTVILMHIVYDPSSSHNLQDVPYQQQLRVMEVVDVSLQLMGNPEYPLTAQNPSESHPPSRECNDLDPINGLRTVVLRDNRDIVPRRRQAPCLSVEYPYVESRVDGSHHADP